MKAIGKLCGKQSDPFVRFEFDFDFVFSFVCENSLWFRVGVALAY